MTNFEKIILTAVGVLAVIVLLVGAIVLRQQKTINALTGSAVGTSKQTATQNIAKKKSVSSLNETIKQFSGTVESVSGNKLMINVKLTDYSKPKDPEKLKNVNGSLNLTTNDFEILEKKITVNTNEKTVFEKKALADLKAGDVVIITSDKSPYMANTVTAEKVTYGAL
jgi:hypothetical protein